MLVLGLAGLDSAGRGYISVSITYTKAIGYKYDCDISYLLIRIFEH